MHHFWRAIQLKSVANTNPTQNEDIRYSDRNTWTEEDKKNYDAFEQQITDYLNGKHDRRNHLLVRETTPKILQDIGLDDKKILMTKKHYNDITHQEGSNKHWHGLTKEQVLEAPIILEHPAIIVDSLTQGSSIVIISELLDDKGRPIIISVNTDGKGVYEYEIIESNFMTSMYGRNNFKEFMQRLLDNDKVLYIDNKKSHGLYERVGLQLPSKFKQLGFDTIIQQSKNVVKTNVTQFQDRETTTLYEVMVEQCTIFGGLFNCHNHPPFTWSFLKCAQQCHQSN